MAERNDAQNFNSEYNSYLVSDSESVSGVSFGGGAGAGGSSNVIGATNYGFTGTAVPINNDIISIPTDLRQNGETPYIPITSQPGLANSDGLYTFRISSNVTNASIFINDENIFKTTPHTFKRNISELALSQAVVTLQKEGYVSNEKYVISVIQNPNYNYGININPYDSLINYTTRGLLDLSNASLVYSTTPLFTIKIEYFKSNVLQEFNYNIDDKIQVLDFNDFVVKKEDPVIEEPVPSESKIKINLDGIDNSVEFVNKKAVSLSDGAQRITTGTTEVSIKSDRPSLIRSADKALYRITSIQLIRNTEILQNLTAQSNESLLFRFDAVAGDIVNVKTEAIVEPLLEDFPILRLTNPETKRLYNLNSAAAIPIGLEQQNNTQSVRVYVNQKEYQYDVPSFDGVPTFIISIPANAFSDIGVYKVIIVPSNTRGDGEFLELTINATRDVWVGIPDIRNIRYPSELFGPDYVGTNVNFNISYETVSTDYVRIYKVGSDKFIKASANGVVTLNFQQLLDLDASQTFEDVDKISIILKLVPYNESGKEVVIGKEELITINFDKGDLTIPRDVAISRIAEAFINQFDDRPFEIDSSKYLTHLLHIGNGDNKVITTWTGSQGSLILKLYEPIPTTIQPNQQVWISKLQANPIVETITISGVDAAFCPPLKGPNFSLEPDNGIGFKVYDELIASGSYTSTDLINKFAEQNSIDTEKLNIQYVSGSSYSWNNFVHFGSAEERVNNFYYKIKILEDLRKKYQGLIADTFINPYQSLDSALLTEVSEEIVTEDSLYTLNWEVYVEKGFNQGEEVQRLATKINNLIRGFDGFEKWLYKTEDTLAFPKENYLAPTGITYRVLKNWDSVDSVSWFEYAIQSGGTYDVYNINSMKNNMPEYLVEDYENSDFLLFLDMIGQHFDILWCYINALKANKNLEHKQDIGITNSMVYNMLDSMGWKGKRAFDSQFLWEYAFGTNEAGVPKYSRSLEDANNEVWRRILNNLPYLLKHKGTGRAMKAIMACYGVPQSMLTIMEFGGPQDPTKGGTTQFTFDDRTAAIYLKENSNVKIPWKEISGFGDYPNAVEFRIQPTYKPTSQYTLISGTEWTLDLVKTTGSFAKLELNFGGDQSTSTYFSESIGIPASYYISYIDDEPYAYGPDLKTGSLDFPISTENYTNVLINRHNSPDSSSWFEVWLATSNGSRITTFVSMSLATDDAQWETGSYLQIGGNGFDGNLDEFRLWKTPLQLSKFQNHTLFPDAINGNDFDSSTKDLVFRLDFEYPKDRNIDPNIKNVAINESYGEPFASASNMWVNATYPYQYVPYDRTVTANVPSLGLTYSNKIRFESASLVTDLSYRTRATKKAFDQAPIDTNRLGLFLSPTKELNMDILKAFGDFNIDNYIGDPSDEYRDSYKSLADLREYYFERLGNRDIYEYIRLVKYIDKSLFDVLSDLAPARTNISKGLLIEPHYLERSKTKWTKPESLRNDYDTIIDTKDNTNIDLEYAVKNSIIDLKDLTEFDVNLPNYDTSLEANDNILLEGTNPTYQSNITYNLDDSIRTEFPTYPNTGSANIFCPTGETLLGSVDVFSSTQIGMERDSLANAGFGLYAKRGNGLVRNWEGVFGNSETTGSRKSIFLVKEQYTEFEQVQISGYPVVGYQPGDQIKYVKQPVIKNKYRVSVLPFSGSIELGNDIVEVKSVNGYLPTHYRFKNNLTEGMQRSYFKGSQQTIATTPDGLEPVETFSTNPNILRVAKTGRGSGEPILEVD
jgi:hypothetical protein